MSAFAAILAIDGTAGQPADVDRVAAVLGSVTGRDVRSWRSSECELLVAPLHAWEARQPFSLAGGRIAAAGDVMVEGREHLARTLQVPANTPAVDLVAHAFDRWGGDCARHLRGEFAFAVWDARDRRLLCARDPLGIRPLYVARAPDAVVVSNVFEAVLAHSRVPDDLDTTALARFVARGVLTSAVATPYRAVRMVPEGHTLAIASSGLATLTRHWHPPAPGRSDGDRADAPALLNQYREVLQRAVGDRVAGRRCAIFLSGGIDSTTLAAVGVECASEMRAITFAYRQFDVDGEIALARSVAGQLSIPIEIVEGDRDLALAAEREGRVPALPVDEPSLSNWRAGLSAAASFSTLAVHGEDGDALFAPPGGAGLLSTQSLTGVLRDAAAFIAASGRLPYLGLRLRERLGWRERPRPREPWWLTPDARQLADAPEDETVLGQPVQALQSTPATRGVWERLLRNTPRTFSLSLSPDVTRQRIALTLPLMDTRVIEFVLSVPSIPWCQDKRLARAAFAGRLPAAVLARPKTPATALHSSLVNSWRRRHLTQALHAASSTGAMDWIDRQRWADALQHGAPDVTMAAWRVLLLDAWLEHASRRVVPCTA